MRQLKIITVVLFLMFPFTSNAALINKDLTTLDDQTGRKWLDLTATANCSYTTFSSGDTCNGINLDDWTFASVADVYGFWINGGVAIENSQSYTASNTTEISSILNLVGVLSGSFGTSSYGANGFVSDSDGLAAQLFVRDAESRDFLFSFGDGPSLNIGAWLYQDAAAAPEPAIVALFGLGLAGMVLVRRKKKA
jgi:hypothetical protein